MSEALEKVRGLDRLPIFPLPLVMLPGEMLPLHIFEPRYRKMLKDTAADRNMFGISLFEQDAAPTDRPPAGSVGCVAEVREIETLPDGRSNIIATGLVRYRIEEYLDVDEPYLVCAAEFFQDDPESTSEVGPLADEVFEIFERIAKAAFRIGGSRGQFPQIERTDPEALSFLVATAFSFDNEKKYRLLEMTSTSKRLGELKEVVSHAVDQMEETAEIQAVSRLNGHSKKKIDL